MSSYSQLALSILERLPYCICNLAQEFLSVLASQSPSGLRIFNKNLAERNRTRGRAPSRAVVVRASTSRNDQPAGAVWYARRGKLHPRTARFLTSSNIAHPHAGDGPVESSRGGSLSYVLNRILTRALELCRRALRFALAAWSGAPSVRLCATL